MTSNIVSNYYTPQVRNVSELQKFKNNYKSMKLDKKINVPDSMKDVLIMRKRNLAVEFLNKTIEKPISKTEYCKHKHISVNTLNQGISILGINYFVKSRKVAKKNIDENDPERSSTIFNENDQSRIIENNHHQSEKTKLLKSKHKSTNMLDLIPQSV
jgi:hypothetical protein